MAPAAVLVGRASWMDDGAVSGLYQEHLLVPGGRVVPGPDRMAMNGDGWRWMDVGGGGRLAVE